MSKPSPCQLQLRHVLTNPADLDTASGEHLSGLILLRAVQVRRSQACNQVVLPLFLSIVHRSNLGFENPLLGTSPEGLIKKLRPRL